MSKKPWTKEELEKLLILFGKMGSSHHAETQAPHKLILEMLKEHGYSWSDLDSLISKARGQASSEQVAIDEVSSNINLVFCDPDRVPYANVTINGHRETFPIDSEEMRQFFQREYWLESTEFSVVSNLLLTRVAGGTRWQQPFCQPPCAIFSRILRISVPSRKSRSPHKTRKT